MIFNPIISTGSGNLKVEFVDNTSQAVTIDAEPNVIYVSTRTSLLEASDNITLNLPAGKYNVFSLSLVANVNYCGCGGMYLEIDEDGNTTSSTRQGDSRAGIYATVGSKPYWGQSSNQNPKGGFFIVFEAE